MQQVRPVVAAFFFFFLFLCILSCLPCVPVGVIGSPPQGLHERLFALESDGTDKIKYRVLLCEVQRELTKKEGGAVSK